MILSVSIFLQFFPFSDRIIHIGLRTAGAAAGESPAAGKRETGAGSCKAGCVLAGLPSPVRSRHCKQVAHCPESGTDIPDSHWSLRGREGGCCVRICKSGNLPAAGAGEKSGSRGIGRAGLGECRRSLTQTGKRGGSAWPAYGSAGLYPWLLCAETREPCLVRSGLPFCSV